ncbi:hypothetical protein BH11CYA1_BH11CYA1_40360 [soil metagenome]
MQKLNNGTIIDNKYTVLDFLGIGGMGVVYKVEQRSLQAIRALKIIDTDKLSDDSWKRFQREAKAASAFDHSNIVKIYDYGLYDNLTPYYVMEVVDGMTLGERININGPINTQQFLQVFTAIAQALSYMHDKGILHRDIKPANIMIEEDASGKVSRVKLLDFGLVKLFNPEGSGALTRAGALTKAGEVIGSPTFMSPEQTAGHRLDQRSDIYSLGCAMFDALTGRPPFLDENPVQVMIMHQSEPIPSLAEMAPERSFDKKLEQIVRATLAKRPGDRYQNMDQVMQDLTAIQSSRQPQFAKELWQNATNRQAYSYEEAAEGETKENIETETQSWSSKRALQYGLIASLAIGLSVAIVATSSYFLTLGEESQISKSSKVTSQSLVTPSSTHAHPDVATEPFSHEAVSSDGKKVIVFDFPTEMSLGEICTASYSDKTNAQGTVTMPAGEIFRFTASKNLMANPQLLERFRNNEIGDLDLSARPGARDEHLAAIKHLKNLAKLNIDDCTLSPSGIAQIDKLPELTDLTLNAANIDDQAFSQLKILRHLHILDIKEILNLSKTIAALSGSTNIQKLVVCNSTMTDEDLKQIAKCPKLLYLNLGFNPSITSKGVRALAPLQKLNNLNLLQDPIAPDSIATLGGFKHLESLKISCLSWKHEDQNTLRKLLPKNCQIQSLNIESTGSGKDLDNLTKIGL